MAASSTPASQYKQWFLDTARRYHAKDSPPRNAADAAARAAEIRARILQAEGDWPAEKAPLDAQILGHVDRDGYRVERLLFQTRPGAYATANTYIPLSGKAPFPAVLCVHGHWAGARMDPVVQSRCIGLAKLGFFVLVLDAWGAGERGTRAGQAEYHGGLLGASLWPVGTPLHGLQLYDNVRALDYIQSRSEVDPLRIGCTGASGGGNQTTYISAFDSRIKCAVPVCSVGTFESYLSAASCVDEVLRGGLTFAEEGDLLGLVAPGALMVITASADVPHFGPDASSLVVERASGYFRATGAEDHVRRVIIESGHDYSRPMREAMYGWMRRWLKSEGDGSPTPEPTLDIADPALIRCFEPPYRSAKVVSTLQWVHRHAEQLVQGFAAPTQAESWRKTRLSRLEALETALGLPRAARSARVATRSREDATEVETCLLVVEEGVQIPVGVRKPAGKLSKPVAAVLLHPSDRAAALASPLAESLREAGAVLLCPELRGCGELTLPDQGLGESIPDHNLVEWSLWIGRPLLGQWVHDVRQTLRAARELAGVELHGVTLVGWREAGLAALLAGALAPEVESVAAIETLASFRSDAVPHQQRMAVFNPDLLRIGDVPQLAGLLAPKAALLVNPVYLEGTPVAAQELETLYGWTRDVFQVLGHPERFRTEVGAAENHLSLLLNSGGKTSAV